MASTRRRSPTPSARRSAPTSPLAPEGVRLDYPDFLHDELAASLGAGFEPILAAMRQRAPVDLRVNTLKTNADAATVVLARDGVQAERQPLARNALRVLDNPRLSPRAAPIPRAWSSCRTSSSQLVAETAGAAPGMTVLDYCAGGGGKTLALAAAMQGRGRLIAWDANPRRMADLPERARRAGADGPHPRRRASARRSGRSATSCWSTRPARAPGAWRRKPEGKWRLTPAELAALSAAAGRDPRRRRRQVRPGGLLVYATCSLLARENEDRAARLRRAPSRTGAPRATGG